MLQRIISFLNTVTSKNIANCTFLLLRLGLTQLLSQLYRSGLKFRYLPPSVCRTLDLKVEDTVCVTPLDLGLVCATCFGHWKECEQSLKMC